MLTCQITGYLYDSVGTVIKAGTLSLRLQQDITSVDGFKVVPVVVEQSLEPLDTPTGIVAAQGGTPGGTSYYYEITAVDGNAGESLLSSVVSTGTGNAVLSVTNYNRLTWTAVEGAATYNIYGRGSSSGGRVLIGSSATAAFNDVGSVIGTPKPTANTSGGYISLSLVPTVGASPAGVAYYVQYDPDPSDTSQPSRAKDGYWQNYWAVPNTSLVPVGSFVSALRGSAVSNYMPLPGTVAALGDTIALGTAANTTRSITAPQSASTPTIRFNPSTHKWELSQDGVVFDEINVSHVVGDITSVVAGDGLTGGGTSGPVTLNVANILDAQIAADAAIAWSKIVAGFIPYSRIPIDNSTIVINGSSQLSAVVPQGVPPGAIVMGGWSSFPTGWLDCNGGAVSRTTYAALFAAIGTTHGTGDGSTTFNVPNLRERFPVGRHSGGTLSALGSTGGQLNHTHTHNQVPNHTHPISVSDPGHSHPVWADTGGGSNTGVTLFGFTDVEQAAGQPIKASFTGISATSSDPSGGVGTVTSSANNPPYIVLNFAIKT